VLGDLDLIAPLGRSGIPCVAVAERGAPVHRSRYVHGSIDLLPTWQEPAAMVERLVQAAGDAPAPPVLFYQGDPDLLLVSRFRRQLAPALRFVVADADLVEDLVDKARFAALAERTGLDVPATLVISPGSTLPGPGAVPFPAIAKPALRSSERWTPQAGGAKAMAVGSYRELEALWARFEPEGVGLIVQELVDGPESAVESYHVYVDDGREIAGEFTGRKIRTRPLAYGVSSAVEVVDLPDVRREGRRITERLGLTGVAKLDFKRADGGRLRLLEINARFNLWHLPGALAGVNLPALVYADLTHTRRPPVRPVTTPVRWVKPWHDVIAAHDSGLAYHRWAMFALGCRAKSAVSWRDPAATLAALRYGLGHR